MIIDTSTDGHVHTRLCHHARGEMAEYVRAAVDRGLDRLIFLEHLEVGIEYTEATWLSAADFEYYFAEGRRLREEYRGRLQIDLGVEVGYNPDRVDAIVDFLGRYPFDRVGLSYHFHKSGDRHLNLVSRKTANIEALDMLGVDRVVADYYQALRCAVEQIPAQVLCHLDAVLRHHPAVHTHTKYRGHIETVLAGMARKGMALEVNTSGYDVRGEPYPSRDILQMAVAQGIDLVAGSDAHRPEDVGRYFDRLADPGFLS